MFERNSRSGLALMFAPLYAGPLAAGWSAAPPVTLAIFAAVFFLIQLRFGRDETQGLPAQIIVLVLLALAQIGVVLMTYGVGMGLAMVTGTLPLPIWFPLALTGCSAAIGALRYRYAQDDAAMLELIERTVNTLETGAPFDVDPHRYAGLLAKITKGLRDDPTPQAHLGLALEQILESGDPVVLAELTALIETLLNQNAPADALPSSQTLITKAKQFPTLSPLITRVQNRETAPTETPTGDHR